MPLGENADSLLHSHARGERMLKLLYGYREPLGLVRVLGEGPRRRGRLAAGLLTGKGRMLGCEKVGKNHRTGQVGYFFLTADHPAAFALADDEIVR